MFAQFHYPPAFLQKSGEVYEKIIQIARETRIMPRFLMKAGIAVSSKEIPKQDILEAYYTRQSIEQIFGFAKDDLDCLPLRCHSEDTIRGYLFLQFLLLIVFIEIRQKLFNHFTVDQAILITSALKCKIYSDQLIIPELTKEQKKIFALTDILVPIEITGI